MQEISWFGAAVTAAWGAGAGYGINRLALHFLGRYREQVWRYGGLFQRWGGDAVFAADMVCVEGMAALLSVAALYRAETWIIFGLTLLILYLILLLSLIDLRIKILPNLLNFSGIVIGLLLACFDETIGIPAALGGMAVGAGFAAATAWIYFRLRGREGLGMGDLKLLAFFGTFAGADGVLFIIGAGSVAAALYGTAAALLSGRRDPARYELPFGPFLGAAALCILIF
jgi:leader peptidase (prepilin peptidase)/N-methyltransferase